MVWVWKDSSFTIGNYAHRYQTIVPFAQQYLFLEQTQMEHIRKQNLTIRTQDILINYIPKKFQRNERKNEIPSEIGDNKFRQENKIYPSQHG